MCQTCIGCNALRCSACGNLLPAPPGRPILPVLPADQADRRR